ncbi:MAG: DNA-binding protein [archaeon]
MNEDEWRSQREHQLREKQNGSQPSEEENRAAMQRQLETILNRILTTEAKTRLTNVRLVNEEKYLRTAQTLLALVQQGRIVGKVTDDQVKQILTQLTPKKDINITRK